MSKPVPTKFEKPAPTRDTDGLRPSNHEPARQEVNS